MSAEKKQKTSKLNQTVKLGIRTGLFYFVRVNSLTPGSIVPKLRYQSSPFVLIRCFFSASLTEIQRRNKPLRLAALHIVGHSLPIAFY